MPEMSPSLDPQPEPGPGSQAVLLALSAFNYGSSISVAAYLVGTTVYAWCYLKHAGDARPSRWRRLALVASSVAVTATYVAQALQFIPYIATAPDDALVHSLSQVLLWIALSLTLLNTTSPSPVAWIGVGVLNLLLETTVCVLTFLRIQDAASKNLYTLGGLQVLSCVALSLFTVVASLFAWPSTDEHGIEETQSLLGRRAHKSSSPPSSVPNYNGSPEIDELADDNSTEVSDEDDDGEADLKAVQKQRLEAKGSWISYLKDFKIFLPFVIPQDDLRLQIYVVILVINMLVIRVLRVLNPRQLGIIIDALTARRGFPWREIMVWIGLEVAASGSLGVGAVNEMLENRLSVWSQQKLSVAAFDHVMGLSMVFHDQKDSGEIIKAIEQAGSLNALLRTVMMDIAPGLLDIFIAMLYITYLFDVYAMLIVIAVGICFVFATYYITLAATAARRQTSNKEREESKLVYESVSNWFTISYFNRKEYAMTRLAHAVGSTAKARLWSDDLYTYLYGAQELAEEVGLLAVSLLAAYRIVQGTSTIGKFVTLESYWSTMTRPLYILGHSYRSLNTDLVDSERLLQLFQQQPSVVDRVGAQPIDFQKGEIRIEDVHFAYEGRDATLKGITTTVEPGQMVALVGETGGGKSTIFKLLMRFHDVTAGRITIDEQDIRDVTLDSLRECFGFVPQDTILFNMSILENVRYGRLDATDAEIYDACRAASIHDKILNFPSGYASKVGERGVKLSGGERQRIAIARVFLKNARIVLLDEATSAMDSQTEAKIQSALRRLVQGRTTFVIAHRLSTIIEADKILVVDNGSIVESGTHHELLLQKGKYLDLWARQTAVRSD